jgi:hypothetical protein
MSVSKQQLAIPDHSTDGDLISLRAEVARIFRAAGFDEASVLKDVSTLDTAAAKYRELILRMARRRAVSVQM